MTVLIADNDAYSVKIISFILEDAGYKVAKVFQAKNILDEVQERNPELIILDVNLDTQNGIDICRKIRQTSDIPIIFVSAQSRVEDRVIGLQAGGDDYICKPFEPSELIARVEAVMRRSDADMLSPTARLSNGPFLLNPVDQSIVVQNGDPIRLTPVEFRLMYFLLKNSGRVLTTMQILEKVWGYDQITSTNLVAVYMRRLRCKIEREPNTPQYVMTVANLGYQLNI